MNDKVLEEKPDDTKREPIVTANAPPVEIITVVRPLSVSEFTPVYDYQLTGLKVSDDAVALKEMFISFLDENKELVLNGIDATNIPQREMFTQGFKNAVALFRLWIDSINIIQE